MKRPILNKKLPYLQLVVASFLIGCGGEKEPVAATHAVKSDPVESRPIEPASRQTLKFGVYTSDKASAVVTQFKLLTRVLEGRLAIALGSETTIKMKVFSTYEEGIDAIANGDVDFMRLGPASYITAREKNPEIQLLCAESHKGEKFFYGILATHDGSDIRSIADLDGCSFAFGDEMSTIGRYLAQAVMVDHGLTSKSLARFDYLGRHDLVGSAVGNKEYDAGALKEGTFNKLKAKGVALREVVRFKNVTKPWVASSRLDSEKFGAIRAALMAIDNPAVFEALGKDGFVSAESSDYDIIEDAMEKAQVSF